MKKRIIAFLMCTVMVLAGLPVSPLADYVPFAFEALAAEAAELMRAFGRLQQATGGNPVVRGAIRVQPHPLPPEGADRCALAVEALCREAICDTKAWIDLCQTVMGRTQDRVVRSCLAAILSDLQRQSERLAHAVKE